MATSPEQIEEYIQDDVNQEAAKIEAQIDAAMRAAKKDAYNPSTGDFIFILPLAIRRRNLTLAKLVEIYQAKGWVYITSRNNRDPLPIGYHLYFSQVLPDPIPAPEEPETEVPIIP